MTIHSQAIMTKDVKVIIRIKPWSCTQKSRIFLL